MTRSASHIKWGKVCGGRRKIEKMMEAWNFIGGRENDAIYAGFPDIHVRGCTYHRYSFSGSETIT
jgi:hypothetical protein